MTLNIATYATTCNFIVSLCGNLYCLKPQKLSSGHLAENLGTSTMSLEDGEAKGKATQLTTNKVVKKEAKST